MIPVGDQVDTPNPQAQHQQNTSAYNPPLAGAAPTGGNNVPYYPPPQYPAPSQNEHQQYQQSGNVPYYPPP